MLDQVHLRDPKSEDLNFVLKSWIRSFANSSYAGPYTRERLVSAIKGTIVDLLARPSTVVRIACLKSRPDFILGFSVFERGWPFAVVHYVYVKRGRMNYRNCGIGRRLTEEATRGYSEIRYTHRTPHSDRILKGARYSPALARYPKREQQDLVEDSTSADWPKPPVR